MHARTHTPHAGQDTHLVICFSSVSRLPRTNCLACCGSHVLPTAPHVSFPKCIHSTAAYPHTYRSSSKCGLKAGHCARFRRCRAALSAGATTATARSAPCSQPFCFGSTPRFGSCSSLGGVLCCQLLVREPWPLGWSIGVGRLTRKQHGVSTALSTRTQTPQYTDTSTHLELDSFLLQKL